MTRALLVLILLSGLGCKHTQPQKDQRPSPMPEAPIPPGHIRIVGTVVRVLAPSGSATSPCDRFACDAQVRIDSVLGYGSGVTATLAVGQQVRMHFPFTLHPTREARPDLQVDLPGLREGDRFRADVEVQGPSPGKSNSLFRIYRYEKLQSNADH